jgi:esterase/lipase
MMFAQFWWKENMNEELVLDELEMTVDAVSGMTVRQFMHSISQHNLMEYHYNDRKRSAYRYDKHYDLITVPALVVTGEFDKIANAYVVHNDLFEKLGSSDKIYTEFAETGHGDMIVGLKAENDLFPLISDWLMERSGEASLVPKD